MRLAEIIVELLLGKDILHLGDIFYSKVCILHTCIICLPLAEEYSIRCSCRVVTEITATCIIKTCSPDERIYCIRVSQRIAGNTSCRACRVCSDRESLDWRIRRHHSEICMLGCSPHLQRSDTVLRCRIQQIRTGSQSYCGDCHYIKYSFHVRMFRMLYLNQKCILQRLDSCLKNLFQDQDPQTW